jgi:hypothetical protein
MRRSTALKLLVGIYALVLVAALANSEGRSDLRELIAGSIIVAAWLRGRTRQRAMEDEGRRLRLRTRRGARHPA